MKEYSIIMKKFAEDLLKEISVDEDPASFLYDAYIKGYTRAVTDCLNLSPGEVADIQKTALEIRHQSEVKCEQVNYIQKYNRALEYCKERLKKCDTVNKVLHSASSDEIIKLYETGWSSHDTCDFYDEYEDLEKKYLIIKKEVIK